MQHFERRASGHITMQLLNMKYSLSFFFLNTLFNSRLISFRYDKSPSHRSDILGCRINHFKEVKGLLVNLNFTLCAKHDASYREPGAEKCGKTIKNKHKCHYKNLLRKIRFSRPCEDAQYMIYDFIFRFTYERMYVDLLHLFYTLDQIII